MVSLKKYVLCKCGASNFFDFNSDMPVEEISVSARCASCGATVHVSVSALLLAPVQQSPTPPAVQSGQSGAQEAIREAHEPSMLDNMDRDTKENVEQAVRDLFG